MTLTFDLMFVLFSLLTFDFGFSSTLTFLDFLSTFSSFALGVSFSFGEDFFDFLKILAGAYGAVNTY